MHYFNPGSDDDVTRLLDAIYNLLTFTALLCGICCYDLRTKLEIVVFYIRSLKITMH